MLFGHIFYFMSTTDNFKSLDVKLSIYNCVLLHPKRLIWALSTT